MANAQNAFLPSKRFRPEQTTHSLERTVARALQEADQERVGALEVGAKISPVYIRNRHLLAAAAQTEIILRRLFTYEGDTCGSNHN